MMPEDRRNWLIRGLIALPFTAFFGSQIYAAAQQEPLVGVFVVVMVAVIGSLGVYASTLRITFYNVRAINTWAKANGFSSQRGRHPVFHQTYPDLSLLPRGKNHHTYLSFTGTYRGHPATLLLYGSTRNTAACGPDAACFGAVLLESPIDLQPLTLKMRSTRLADLDPPEQHQVDFESNAFNHRYHVTAADRRWAFDVLHARTIAHLLEQEPRDLCMGNQRLLIPLPDLLRIQDIVQALDLGATLLDQLPSYLRVSPSPPLAA